MTEAEWLACDAAEVLYAYLNEMSPVHTDKMSVRNAFDRKVRLSCLACLRRVPAAIDEHLEGESIEKAEELVDGLLGRKRRSKQSSEVALLDFSKSMYELEVEYVLCSCYGTVAEEKPTHQRQDRIQEEMNAQAAIWRDVFGNPFRTMKLAKKCVNATARQVADAIYADRAFDRLPILADALEDAGCTNGTILDHCRQPGEHVRGCWVVDLVLGKE